MGGNCGAATKKLTYPIPPRVVEIASGLTIPEKKIQGISKEKRVSFVLPTETTPIAPTGKTPDLFRQVFQQDQYAESPILFQDFQENYAESNPGKDPETLPTRGQAWVQERLQDRPRPCSLFRKGSS